MHLTRERHQRAHGVVVGPDVLVNSELPAHRFKAAADHHHGLGLAVQQRGHELTEVLYHHLHLLGDVVGVQPHPAHDAFHGGVALHLGLVQLLPVVGQLEGQAVGRVVLQHVQNEAFFNRLPHRVHMKRPGQVVGRRLAAGVGPGAKQLQRLVLGRGGKGHEGDAAVLGTAGHLGSQNVLRTDFTTIV